MVAIEAAGGACIGCGLVGIGAALFWGFAAFGDALGGAFEAGGELCSGLVQGTADILLKVEDLVGVI